MAKRRSRKNRVKSGRAAREPVLRVRARVSEKRRRRRYQVGSLLLLSVLLAGAAVGGIAAFRAARKAVFADNPAFAVRHFDLQSDGVLQARHIREYSGLREDAGIFSSGLDEIRDSLESVPRVHSALVRRVLPDKLEIRINERVPLAVVRASPRELARVIDRDGVVIGPAPRSTGLPELRGLAAGSWRDGESLASEDTRPALQVLELCSQPLLGQILSLESVSVDRPDYLELRLRSGTRVLLGRDRIDWRLRRVAGIMQKCREMGEEAAVIKAVGYRNFPVEYR